MDAATVNDKKYIDVTFEDTFGVGLDPDTITDQDDAEIVLWGQDAAGNTIPLGVRVNGAAAPVENKPNTYRYYFSDPLPSGVVLVEFQAGSWADKHGNLSSAKTESFRVFDSAASFEILIQGSEEIYLPFVADQLVYGIHGEARLLTEILNNEVRAVLDFNGTAEIVYLGNIASTAGRFVLSAPDSATPQFWGVARLDTNFEKLKGLGIELEGYGLLEVNTTNEPKSETLTLAGQGPNGSDLTRTFEFGPECSASRRRESPRCTCRRW